MGSTAAAKVNGSDVVQWIDYREKLNTIKQTVAKGASDAQLEMFLELCNRYQLDPFLKEIWYVPSVGVISSRDGYLKVAQRDANFDGIVSAAVCAGDTFEIDPIAPTVRHSFGAKRGEVLGAYAIVFHKQRRPAVCFAPYEEYKKDSSVWKTYKSAMICKVAEVLALKRQFGISGLVTEEEIGTQQQPEHPERYNLAQKQVLEAKDVTIDAKAEPSKEAVLFSPDEGKPWGTVGERRGIFKTLHDLFTEAGLKEIFGATVAEYTINHQFKSEEAAMSCYRALYDRYQEWKAGQAFQALPVDEEVFAK